MDRLSQTAVDELGGDVRRWRYDRAQLPVGIVHLGLGAFARAHLLSFTDDALERAFGPFGVCGVSLRSPLARDRVFPQDGLYTVAERSGEAERPAGDRLPERNPALGSKRTYPGSTTSEYLRL